MLPHLDVDQLKTFLAIADSGSFTRAAEEVNKTQSAVSMQMKRLEESLGRPLFAKEGRGTRFTNDGERLIEYARRIVALSDEAVSAFMRPAMTGTVRFGTPDDYADLFLPEILARFARTHPQVNVDVECVNSETLMERTRRGDIDLCVVTFGSMTPHEPDDVIRKEALHWVTSAKHSVHLLDTVPLALPHVGCAWRKMALEKITLAGRKHRVAYSSPNSSTINAAVVQGLAVGSMPAICIRPGMRVLTEEDGFPFLGTFDIGLIRKPGRSNPVVDELARHIKEGLSSRHFSIAAE